MKRLQAVMAATLLVATGFGPGLAVAQEVEPNNTCATAQVTSSAVDGAIGAKDVDYYRFSGLPGSRFYRISMRGAVGGGGTLQRTRIGSFEPACAYFYRSSAQYGSADPVASLVQWMPEGGSVVIAAAAYENYSFNTTTTGVTGTYRLDISPEPGATFVAVLWDHLEGKPVVGRGASLYQCLNLDCSSGIYAGRAKSSDEQGVIRVHAPVTIGARYRFQVGRYGELQATNSGILQVSADGERLSFGRIQMVKPALALDNNVTGSCGGLIFYLGEDCSLVFTLENRSGVEKRVRYWASMDLFYTRGRRFSVQLSGVPDKARPTLVTIPPHSTVQLPVWASLPDAAVATGSTRLYLYVSRADDLMQPSVTRYIYTGIYRRPAASASQPTGELP